MTDFTVFKQDQRNIHILLSIILPIFFSACQQPLKQVEIETPRPVTDTTPSVEKSDPTITSENTAKEKTIDNHKTPHEIPRLIVGSPSETAVKHKLTTRRDNNNSVVASSPVEKQSPKKIEPQPVAVRGRKTMRGQNKFYDRKSPQYKSLQKANHALAGFPVDTEGQVNWVLALDRGMIKPRTTVRGNRPMEILDTEIIMKNTREMANVRFPHKAHTEWLACKNCHDDIFIPTTGANDINMTRIFQGEYCGSCHDKVAFSSFVCERCHSIPITIEQ